MYRPNKITNKEILFEQLGCNEKTYNKTISALYVELAQALKEKKAREDAAEFNAQYLAYKLSKDVS